MKIALFTDTFYPMINGIVTSTMTFLDELTKNGHEIIVFTPYNKGIEKYRNDNVKIVSLKGIPAIFYPEFKFTLFQTKKIYTNLKKFKPDIIHFHTQFNLGFKAIIFGKSLKIPIVGSYHTKIADKSYLKTIKFDNIKIVESFARTYNNFFYKQADFVLTPSMESRQELIEHGIDGTKIGILKNPLTIPHDIKIEKFYKNKLGEENILYIGRISREKNIDIALKVFKKISETFHNLNFVIIGDGPAKQEISEQIKKLGLAKKVKMLGKIPHEDLIRSDIFQKCKFFLTCSTSETFGITLIEANYFSLPVIGINQGGVGEVIIDGYNGLKSNSLKVSEISKLGIKLLKDKTLRTRLGENAKEFTKEFDRQELTKQLENFYEEIIKKYETKSLSLNTKKHLENLENNQ